MRNLGQCIAVAILVTVVLGIVTDTLNELPAHFPRLVSLRAAAVPRRMVGHPGPAVCDEHRFRGAGHFLPAGRPWSAARFLDLLSGWRWALPAFLATLITTLIVTIGLICCVLPGIIAFLMLSQTMYLIVDRDLGAITALETSHSLTDGQKWDLFLLFVLVVLLGFLACLPCLLGLLFYFPWVGVLGAVTYLQLSGQHVGEP